MSSTGNKMSGAIEYIQGKLQRVWGKLTGNRSMRARGMGHQARGGTRYGFGKAEGSADDLKR
jgi:uncharacterized protein YjbJ (UPF0337 family)